jgi:long-subunit acyl-CoA synthetase (AMP-forming)
MLLPELFTQFVSAAPTDRFATSVTEKSDGQFGVQKITRKEFLLDTLLAARHMIDSGCYSRQPGEATSSIALFATSSYDYFVYEIAINQLGCTVSCKMQQSFRDLHMNLAVTFIASKLFRRNQALA